MRRKRTTRTRRPTVRLAPAKDVDPADHFSSSGSSMQSAAQTRAQQHQTDPRSSPRSSPRSVLLFRGLGATSARHSDGRQKFLLIHQQERKEGPVPTWVTDSKH